MKQAYPRQVKAWKAAAVVALTATLVAVGGTAAIADTLPSGPAATGITGLRPNATRLSWRLSDKTQASVDVATGNLNVATVLRTLPGVKGSVPITLAYNSRASAKGDNFMSAADSTGWTYGLAGAGSLSLQPNGTTVDFTSTDGAVWAFTPVSGSTTAYTAPAGLQATLTKTSTGWTLYYLKSSQTVKFDGSGRPISVAERNANTTTINWSTGVVTSSAGAVDARTLFLSYDGTYNTQHFDQQQNNSNVRDQFVSQNSTGVIQSWSYPTGTSASVDYNSASKVSKIFGEDGYELDVAYDSTGRVTSVSQVDNSGASPAAVTAVTRLSYPSSTQTLVAGPNTSQSSSVSSVPHLTYTINSSTNLVTQATDEIGRVRAATYNANLDTLTSTTGSGSSATTTTNTYGANSGVSLTNSTSSTGAASSAAYANTTPATQYLPSSTTDAAGNTSTYTFNGAGNQLTAQTAAVAATANVTYNTDGTVATATLPGNGSNSTTYSYNSNHQLTAINPVSGSSLGTKNFTYDVYGRLKTASDGGGRTTTYTYDDADRLLTTAFSDSTPTVTNTYDNAGNLTGQVSAGGTITNTYDAFNRLTSTSNTAGGGTISYTYDKAGNRASLLTSKGTTTYSYDTSGVLTAVSYPASTTPAQRSLTFATDTNGRRTDEWLGTSSTWAGHTHTSYDGSGRVSNVTAETKSGSTTTTVINVDYCYNTGGSGASCATTSANDRSKLQWTYNHISGQTTTYTYDGAGRLTQAAQSGGSGSNTTYAYAYNANGDRTSATVSGSSSSSQTLTYNAADQITNTGYTYDGAGNLTASPGKTFTYNAAEQMTTATISGTTYTYKYAGASQNALLSVTGNSQTRSYAYGGSDAVGNPQLEIFTNSAASSPTYIYNDPHTGQPLFTEEKTSDNGALIVYDGTGNPIALLETWADVSQSTSYQPYGLATISSSSVPDVVAHNPYTFKGGIKDDPTGLIKFGQRWFNATTGAWTQQDTLDAPLDPSNANRYAYAGDDPINGFDPTGFASDPKQFAETVGAFAGGAAAVGGLIGCAVTVEIGCVEGGGAGAVIGGAAGAAFGLGYAVGEAVT